jgi:CRP-like cAMP-binding protein
MNAFTNHLLQFTSFNEKQLALIHSKLSQRSLQKNEYFSEAGKVAREMAFVAEGILRACFYNNKGEEITQHFIPENNFVADLDSFFHRVYSNGYMQAVTDCELIVLSIDDFEELSATILNWELIFQKIATKVLLDKTNNLKYMMADDAQTKYERFLEHFPNLANRVPLVQIASFLGITPSSLSRIRRKKA